MKKISDEELQRGLHEYTVDVRESKDVPGWRWHVAANGEYVVSTTGTEPTREEAQRAALLHVLNRCENERKRVERLLGIGLEGEIAALDRFRANVYDDDTSVWVEYIADARAAADTDRVRAFRENLQRRYDRYEGKRWLSRRKP